MDHRSWVLCAFARLMQSRLLAVMRLDCASPLSETLWPVLLVSPLRRETNGSGEAQRKQGPKLGACCCGVPARSTAKQACNDVMNRRSWVLCAFARLTPSRLLAVMRLVSPSSATLLPVLLV